MIIRTHCNRWVSFFSEIIVTFGKPNTAIIMKKLYRSGNYIVYKVDSTIQHLFTITNSKFTATDSGYILEDTSNEYKVSIQNDTLTASEWEDNDSNAYTIASMESFLLNNTGFNTALGGSRADLFLSELASLDGTGNDASGVVQAAVDRINADDFYHNLILPPGTYHFDSTVNLTDDITIKSERATIETDSLITAFTSSAINVRMEHIDYLSNGLNGGTFMNQISDFNQIYFDDCNGRGVIDEVSNYLLLIDDAVSGNDLKFWYGGVDDMVLVIGSNDDPTDRIQRVNLFGTKGNNCPRYFCRLLNVNTDVPYVGNLTANHCDITNINGNLDLTGATQVARVFQIGVAETACFYGVKADTSFVSESDIHTGDSGNFLYLKQGSLKINGCTIKDLRGDSNTAIIDPKGVYNADSTWDISGNQFDFSGISHTTKSQAVIRILHNENVQIKNNGWKGLKCEPVVIEPSLAIIQAGQYPKNITISGNEIYDIDWPVPFRIRQNAKNVTIKGNVIHNITNTENASVDSLTYARVFSVQQTINNEGGPVGITVKDNVIMDTNLRAYVGVIWINNAAPNGTMDRIRVTGNEIMNYSGAGNGSFLHFAGSLTAQMTNCIVRNNTGISAMIETSGTAPGDLIVGNNEF